MKEMGDCSKCKQFTHDKLGLTLLMIGELRQEINQLKQQIEKMKNNDNCLHGSRDRDGTEECDLDRYMTKCPCDKWELRNGRTN